jgi:disulfide oxidoreductase YuzD
VVEHSLGKGEVDSSILSSSTSLRRGLAGKLEAPQSDFRRERHLSTGRTFVRAPAGWHVFDTHVPGTFHQHQKRRIWHVGMKKAVQGGRGGRVSPDSFCEVDRVDRKAILLPLGCSDHIGQVKVYEDTRIIEAMLQAAEMKKPREPIALENHHVEGARLYAERKDMVSALRAGAHGVVAEVGVALGDFSEFLLNELRPTRFIAIDLFTMHEHPVIWGRPSSELFRGMTQLEFYRTRFSDHKEVAIEVGPSFDILEKYPDQSFDMLYIDAGHDYDDVAKDAAVAARKIKQEGTIIFNDYIMYDHIGGGHYGVVQAVNELVTQGGWRVVGLALQRHMFCDIAIQRA